MQRLQVDDFDAWYENRKKVIDRWYTPLAVAWILLGILYLSLTYYVKPSHLDDYSFDPAIHDVLDDDGNVVPLEAVADEEGNMYFSHWKDKTSGKVYHDNHPKVKSGEFRTGIYRVISTLFCGICMLGIYCLREKEIWDGVIPRQYLINGAAIILIAAAISYFRPVVEIVQIILSVSSRGSL
jgi:hypothetical protein